VISLICTKRIKPNNKLSMGFNSFPAGPKQPSPSEKAKSLALESLRSESQVHAGFEALSVEERGSVESILSAAGTCGLSDPILEKVPGETLRDLLDHAKSTPNSEERKTLGKGIVAAITAAREASYSD
jgi:hypothetical protein